MWWHMYFGTGLACDDQIQSAGDAAFGYDDRTKLGPFHDAVIVAQAEATHGISLGRFVVALNTACLEDRFDIA